MKNKVLLFYVLLMLGCSCKPESPTQITEEQKRRDLVWNLIVTHPYLNPQYNNLNLLSFLRRKYAKEVFKIESKKLGITAYLYDDQVIGNAPGEIIYLESGKFNFAFPFLDEYYYEEGYNKNDPSYYRYPGLNLYSNYIADSLGIVGDKEKLKELTVFIADSVLGLRRINSLAAADQVLKLVKPDGSLIGTDSCVKYKPIVLERIRKNISNNNYFYYLPRVGNYAFWEFKISDDPCCPAITLTFLNKECYRSFRGM